MPDRLTCVITSGSAALHNGLLKRNLSLSSISCHLQSNAVCAKGFSENSNIVWISAKIFDVLLDPFQAKSLIEKSNV